MAPSVPSLSLCVVVYISVVYLFVFSSTTNAFKVGIYAGSDLDESALNIVEYLMATEKFESV